MGNQKAPRLQHYVPQLLLRRFAGVDGNLWAYDAKANKMFCSAPKNLAAEGYFYGPTTEHATAQSTAIETWLAKEIEGPAAEAISELLQKRANLPRQLINAFFVFVAAQMQRTPASLKRVADSFTPMFQETAARLAKYNKEFRERCIADARASGDTDDEIAEFVRLLDEGAFTVTPTREFTISMAFDVIELIARELAKMHWKFMSLKETDNDLIIGDNPVTAEDVGPPGTLPQPLGIKNPHIEIAMPLSPRMMAIAHWDGPISYGELCSGMADQLNERTLRHIHRFAYASFESKELLTRAVALRGTGPKMSTRRIQMGEKLIIDSEFK